MCARVLSHVDSRSRSPSKPVSQYCKLLIGRLLLIFKPKARTPMWNLESDVKGFWDESTPDEERGRVDWRMASRREGINPAKGDKPRIGSNLRESTSAWSIYLLEFLRVVLG